MTIKVKSSRKSVVLVVCILLLTGFCVWVWCETGDMLPPIFDGCLTSDSDAEQATPIIIEEDCGELYMLTGGSMDFDADGIVYDESIAVNENGRIAALSSGQTRISVTEGDVCKYWTLTVSDYQAMIAPMGKNCSWKPWVHVPNGSAAILSTFRLMRPVF